MVVAVDAIDAAGVADNNDLAAGLDVSIGVVDVGSSVVGASITAFATADAVDAPDYAIVADAVGTTIATVVSVVANVVATVTFPLCSGRSSSRFE